MLEALTDAQVHRRSKLEVLTNGENFYEAELEAIRSARHHVHIEAYIFSRGKLTERFVRLLAEKARAGVQVRVVVDAIGSLTTTSSYFKELTTAGGRVHWYHPLRWHTWPRYNNRTHRELVIVDGRVGFIGGAGFADHWIYGEKHHPRWRDTMVRVEGDTVVSLQSTFVENWLESSGEVLAGRDFFPPCEVQAETAALVVNSTPSAGSSTRARLLFQTLLASAQKSIRIQTPYFVPDWSARKELAKAVARGVEVKVIVPGHSTDIVLTRHSGRRIYGELLEAGVEMYEYEPAMTHVKCMVIDDVWSVVGSTNFDNRSFGLNDEVNLAALDRGLAQRLTEDFCRDLAQSHRITYERWRKRPLYERAHEALGWLLERQQ
jgi:cardiolipin synthase